MTPTDRPSTASIVGRSIAGVVAALAGMVFLLMTWLALSSRFGRTENDMHGYGIIFGTVLAIMAAFVTATILPLALAPRLRGRAYAISLTAFALSTVGLIASMATA